MRRRRRRRLGSYHRSPCRHQRVGDDRRRHETTTASSDTTETTAGSDTHRSRGRRAEPATSPMTRHHRPQPGRRVGGRDPDHVGRLCSARWQAVLNTPGSLVTAGYDKIISVEKGTSDKQAIVSFSDVLRARTRRCSTRRRRPSSRRPPSRTAWTSRATSATMIAVSGRNVQDRVLAAEGQSVLVPERELLGRRQAGDRAGRHGPADRSRHRAGIDQVGTGRLHLPAAQRRPQLRALGDPNIKLDIKNGGRLRGASTSSS